MKRHCIMKFNRTVQIVKVGTNERGFRYVLFGYLENEPELVGQVVLSPEEMKDLFSKYKALEG